LAIDAGERHPLLAKLVQFGGADVRIVQSFDRVVALLIGADPEKIWLSCGNFGRW
jgi:hypothetical protein